MSFFADRGLLIYAVYFLFPDALGSQQRTPAAYYAYGLADELGLASFLGGFSALPRRSAAAPITVITMVSCQTANLSGGGYRVRGGLSSSAWRALLAFAFLGPRSNLTFPFGSSRLRESPGR